MEVNLLLRGQSNALLFADTGGAARLEQGLGAALPGVDVKLLYQWNDAGGANTINSGTEFLTEWMSGTQAGRLEQGLLDYIQGQPADIKDNPTLELWMQNESDQKNAGSFSAADWTAAYEANKAMVEQAFGHAVATEFVPIRYNWGDIGPILDGMKAAVADGAAAGIDMSAYNLAKMDWGGTPDTEHMSASDAQVVADALAQALAPLVASLAKGAAAPAPTPTPAPVQASLLAGPDTLVVHIPQDAHPGGVQHTVEVDDFQARYGALSNQGFVERFYLDALGRPGDGPGIAHWTGALDAGALTRAEVVAGFASSPEMAAKLAPLAADGIFFV